MAATASARNFWERKVEECNPLWLKTCPANMVRYSDSPVWASIYCTIRDRRRSRSRTCTSNSLPRSRTPSSVSSDRTTTSSTGPLYRLTARTMSEELLDTLSDVPLPASVPLSPHKFQTTCWFEPRSVPVHYSSSVYIKLGSTKKRYVEEVTYQTRLVPRWFSESMESITEPTSRRYTAGIEIKCIPPPVNVISLEPQQQAPTQIAV